MKRNEKGLLAVVTILVVLAPFLLDVLPACAGDFGSGAKFDSPTVEESFILSSTEQNGEESYFRHDQLIKLIFLLAFMGFAGAIILRGGYEYRKILLIASVAVLGFYLGGFLCPLAAVQNLFMKWQTGYLLFFLTVIILALLRGRVFCGYVCPFGAVQELLHLKRISRKIPAVWNRYLTKAKYVLLGYLVVIVLATGQVILQDSTPFKALFTWGGDPLSIGLALSFAILSLIMYRPFCRYFCPLGAALALFSRFRLFEVRVNSDCAECGLCEKLCKCQAITGRPPAIDSSECILCGDCLKKCPKSAVSTQRTKIPDLSPADFCPAPLVEKNPGMMAK